MMIKHQVRLLLYLLKVLKTLLGIRSIIKICVNFSFKELIIPVNVCILELFKSIKGGLLECPWTDSDPLKIIFLLNSQGMIEKALEEFKSVFSDFIVSVF